MKPQAGWTFWAFATPCTKSSDPVSDIPECKNFREVGVAFKRATYWAWLKRGVV